MDTEPTTSPRLDRLEARLERLEGLQVEAEQREHRRRRRETWARLGVLLFFAVAYAVYLGYLPGP